MSITTIDIMEYLPTMELSQKGPYASPPVFLLFPREVRLDQDSKERICIYESNQTSDSHGPDAGGSCSRRLGTSLGLDRTGSKEEAQACSRGAGATGGHSRRRSGAERRAGRAAAANPAT